MYVCSPVVYQGIFQHCLCGLFFAFPDSVQVFRSEAAKDFMSGATESAAEGSAHFHRSGGERDIGDYNNPIEGSL